MKQYGPIELNSLSEGFEEADRYIGNILNENGVADTTASETAIVFEALCSSIFEQKKPEDGPVTVSGRSSMGDVSLVITYDGAMYDAESMSSAFLIPEQEILRAFADKIDYGYRLGHNRIVISVRRSHIRMTALYALAIILGIIAYQIIMFFMSDSGTEALKLNFTSPLVKLFSNAVLMVGAPVTFLSLLKNMTDTYILSEKNSKARQLQKATVVSSIFAVVCAIVLNYVIAFALSEEMTIEDFTHLDLGMSPGEIISSLIPSDIFTPFQTFSPFPLLIVAVLVTYAFCSVGRQFDKLKSAVDVCYALFSRLLSIVMFALPFFTFIGTVDFLLRQDFSVVLGMIMLIALVVAGLCVFCLYYLIRIKINGISARSFIRNILPLLRENAKISSAIDAAPFNIRYIAKTFGIDRKKLKDSVPVLAQINLDGNCFLITLIALMIILLSATMIYPIDAFSIGFLVFFLSFGAPNQPGSCLIALIIILQYLNAPNLMPLAIFSEAVFGGLLNLVNVAGDVVAIVTDDAKERKNRT